jgi:hypothetical protein
MPRLLAEGVVVILSILIAFFLDASWDNAELARELGQDLLSVEEELRANIDSARDHVELVERIVGGSEGVLAAMTADRTASLVSVPDTAAWFQAMTPTFEASLGAVDALVASGRMSAVDDREVQRRLAGLRSAIDDAVEEQWEAQRFFEATQAPELFAVLDLTELSYLSDQFSSGLEVESRRAVDYPNTTSMRSAVEYRRYLYMDTVRSLNRVIRGLEETVEMLAQLPR